MLKARSLMTETWIAPEGWETLGTKKLYPGTSGDSSDSSFLLWSSGVKVDVETPDVVLRHCVLVRLLICAKEKKANCAGLNPFTPIWRNGSSLERSSPNHRMKRLRPKARPILQYTVNDSFANEKKKKTVSPAATASQSRILRRYKGSFLTYESYERLGKLTFYTNRKEHISCV